MKTHAARLALSAAAVAVVTSAIFGLKQIAPVLSLGELYVFAVLPVAIFYGLAYALAVSIASMADVHAASLRAVVYARSLGFRETKAVSFAFDEMHGASSATGAASRPRFRSRSSRRPTATSVNRS